MSSSELISAIRNKRVDEVITMLNDGVDPNEMDSNGDIPLTVAVRTDNPIVLEKLLDHGARIDDKDSRGETALTLAVDYNRMESARLLLQRGASFRKKNGQGKSAFDIAESLAPNREEIMEALLKAQTAAEENAHQNTLLRQKALKKRAGLGPRLHP